MIRDFPRCGHPMTDENAPIRKDGSVYCRICRNEGRRKKYWEDPAKNVAQQRRRALPGRIERARARLAKLEVEAISLGLSIRPSTACVHHIVAPTANADNCSADFLRRSA